MKKFTVLIEARPFCAFDNTPMEQLRDAGMNLIDMRGAGVQDPKFVEALQQADAILCGNDLVVNDKVLDMAPGVKAIAKMGAGLDTVDIDAASRHNAVVFHTPGANNQAVADHTFALMLNVARKIIYCDNSLRAKRWEHTKIMGLEIWQKTLGLIGLGAIGRCVALRAKGFEMKVVAHDPFWPEAFAAEQGIEQVEIEELLRVSDVVSIHAPLTPDNKGMIDADALNIMKPTAILINAARGGIVNEADLYEGLKNNVIAGAGIDVFEHEPPSDSPLLELENVVLTPHTAAFTFEGMNNMSVGVVAQLIEFQKGNKPEFIVNSEVYDRQSAG
ncbi:MAG: phosphoglycerate dehydrogenase [Deltaproteobacteria bacterium]|jgi:D-3-phosphoglycerate dehydrogenase|nr:phosphoglycerate dehydrogenase [Deltaproteobacteria bacterium]MBW2480703.1 phosphoglycerate dehydrogenase [Deltaproteobacteria bacterium]